MSLKWISSTLMWAPNLALECSMHLGMCHIVQKGLPTAASDHFITQVTSDSSRRSTTLQKFDQVWVEAKTESWIKTSSQDQSVLLQLHTSFLGFSDFHSSTFTTLHKEDLRLRVFTCPEGLSAKALNPVFWTVSSSCLFYNQNTLPISIYTKLSKTWKSANSLVPVDRRCAHRTGHHFQGQRRVGQAGTG